MMFMMAMILNDRVSSLWVFMERLDGICIFLRFGYICRDIYLVLSLGTMEYLYCLLDANPLHLP